MNDDPKKQFEAAQHTANAAQRAADEADAQLEREHQRVKLEGEELDAREAELKAVDPDDRREFAKRVAARDTAKASLSALQARVTEAERLVKAAQADLAVAKLAAARAEVREIAARREEVSAEIVADVRAFATSMAERLATHQKACYHDESMRALSFAAGGESLPETLADRFTDPAHAVATVIVMMRDEAAAAAWLASDGPRRQEEALRRERERTAQHIAEATFEGDLDGTPDRVRVTPLGDEPCLTD